MPTKPKTTKTTKAKTLPWTPHEQNMFKAAVAKHGAEDLAAVKRVVSTRTEEEVRAYAATQETSMAMMAAQGMKTRACSAPIASRGGGGGGAASSDDKAKKAAAPIAAPPATTTVAAAAAPRLAAKSKPKPKPKPKARGPKEGHWTEAEHELFLACWAKHGKAWKKIAAEMKTRSNEQIRTHAQKYFTKLEQLRHYGYDGSYSMDGTRHLTKSFVTKAQKEGRMGTEPTDWVNPLRPQNRRRRNHHHKAGADEPAAAAAVGINSAWRRSVRTAMEEAKVKGQDEMEIDGAAVVADEEEAPAPLPLPLPLPLDCHHAAAPCAATAALAKDDEMVTATAGSESAQDEMDEEDARAYGELDSSFLDGHYDDLPAAAAATATADEEEEHLDHPGFLLNEYMCMGGGCSHHEVGEGEGEGGGGKGVVSASSTTVSVASTAGAVVALPVGADAPTHDAVMLDLLLGGGGGGGHTSSDHHHHGSSCDSSMGWGAEATEAQQEQEDDTMGDVESHLLPDTDLLHDEHHDQENEQPTTTIHWHGKRLAIQF